MPEQVIPIQGLHTVGWIDDTPAISLPPNALSDVQNVRFDNSGINKMPGEFPLITETLISDAVSGFLDIQYVAWWEHPDVPNSGYYVIVITVTDTNFPGGTSDRVIMLDPLTNAMNINLGIVYASGGDWQHTIFQGGFSIILNNGINRPFYIANPTNNAITGFTTEFLPGWDNYNTTEVIVDNAEYDSATDLTEWNLGRTIDFTRFDVRLSVVRNGTVVTNYPITFTEVGTPLIPDPDDEDGMMMIAGPATLALDEYTNTHTVTIGRGLQQDDVIRITIRSLTNVQTTAGVIRTWGDTLVAGDIREVTYASMSGISGTRATFLAAHGLTVGASIQILNGVNRVVTVTAINDNTTNPDNPVYAVTLSAAVTVTGTVIDYYVIDGGSPVRSAPGLVRISDVAPPGSVPTNWNPFAIGVSTAEEFQLSSTSNIVELAELQGNLYVYSRNSIYSITSTGNFAIPYISDVVTTSYGCLSKGCVIDFKGAHIVVGSNDIYQFSGHPGSIQSIANDRVRDYFYDELNSAAISEVQMLLHHAENEVWIPYPRGINTTNTDTLIWNYNYNVWSRRSISGFTAGFIAPERNKMLMSETDPDTMEVTETLTLGTTFNLDRLRPVFFNHNRIFEADVSQSYTDLDDMGYESYFERLELALVPEFDVESLHSVALHTSKDISGTIPLRLRYVPTDAPGESTSMSVRTALDSGDSGSTNPLFTIGDDYKTDVRLNGRFINYRITDQGNVSDKWSITQMQLQVMKGGRR